jgi:hypothetical protein
MMICAFGVFWLLHLKMHEKSVAFLLLRNTNALVEFYDTLIEKGGDVSN